MTDDQATWATGCYGNDDAITPNIDRLASTGVLIENFFCSTPVCSPSRATFLTGRIASQTGVHDWIRKGNTGPDATSYLAGQITYTDILARYGWSCGISGKWHLGNSEIPQHGFSHWFTHEKGGGPYNNATMVKNGQLTKVPGYITTAITDDAIDFITSCVDSGIPFYSSIHYTAPHLPWVGHPEKYVNLYDDCNFESCPQGAPHPWASNLTDSCMGDKELVKGYFAATTAMDYDVGRIIAHLNELGIREDTLVVFTSDNGFNLGHHGFWGKGNGTYPQNMYESSIRVPFIISQPGSIPSGQTRQNLVSNYDFMPTLLDYLDLEHPAPDNLPGNSFVPALCTNGITTRETVTVYDEYGPTRMIRDPRWKYVHRYETGPDELYDLQNDCQEQFNLAHDARHKDRIVAMKQSLITWFNQYSDPMFDGKTLPVTGRGQLGRITDSNYPDSIVFHSLGGSSATGREDIVSN